MLAKFCPTQGFVPISNIGVRGISFYPRARYHVSTMVRSLNIRLPNLLPSFVLGAIWPTPRRAIVTESTHMFYFERCWYPNIKETFISKNIVRWIPFSIKPYAPNAMRFTRGLNASRPTEKIAHSNSPINLL